MLRHFEWDAVLARQRSDRGEFLAAAIQPEQGEVIAAEKSSEITADEAAGCSTACQRMLPRLRSRL
jgi:hypothetical protein